MALVREHYGARAPVVFGWVFASHQVGAAVMALVAGIIRDRLHTYDAAWSSRCAVPRRGCALARGRPGAHQPQGGSARVVPPITGAKHARQREGRSSATVSSAVQNGQTTVTNMVTSSSRR